MINLIFSRPILLLVLFKVILIGNLYANFHSNYSNLFQITFESRLYIDKKLNFTQIKTELKIQEAINRQLNFILSPLTQGLDIEDKPPIGFRAIPYGSYEVKILNKSHKLNSRGKTYTEITFNYKSKIQIENTKTIDKLNIILPLWPFEIQDQGRIKKSFSKKYYNPCSDYHGENEFSFSWRPWRNNCNLKENEEYIKIIPSLTHLRNYNYSNIQFLKRPNIYFAIYDDVIGVKDTGDMTRKELFLELNKLNLINKSILQKEKVGIYRKDISFNFFESKNAKYFLFQGATNSKSFYEFLNISFQKGDIVYFLGHTDITRYYKKYINDKPQLSNTNQIIIFDSCSSFHFENHKFYNLKKEGQLAIISNGSITKGTNQKAISIIRMLENGVPFDLLEYFNFIDQKKYENELISLDIIISLV